jgi:S1-C subfamily serine protease
VQINPGNSGGPLCDQSGRVAGIVAAKTFTERFVQGYGLAIPMGDALPFIQKTVPDYAPTDADAGKIDWTEVDGRISKSTVLILIKKKRKP